MSIDVYPPKGMLVPGTAQVTIPLNFVIANTTTGMVTSSVSLVDTGTSTAGVTWVVPANYASGDITFAWTRRSISGTGTAKLAFYTERNRPGADVITIDASFAADFTPGATVNSVVSRSVASAQFQSGDAIIQQLIRSGSDAGDTMAGVVVVSGVTVTYLATTHQMLTAQAYDLGVSWSGTLPANQVLLRYPFPRAVTFPAGLSGSQAIATAAATGAVALTLAKNGTAIGTINFAAAATSGTFTFGSSVSFAVGEVLTVTAPASPDATLAGLGIALAGTR